MIVHKGKAYRGDHSAIVKANLFEKVQDVLRANKTYTHRHQVRRSALLRGLLRCGECGSLIQPAWTTNHGREYRYYACAKRVKTGDSKCGLPTLPAGEIETVVVDQLRALFRHPDVIARTYRETQERSSSGPSQEATEQLAQLCQRREQLRESIRAVLGLGNQNEFMSEIDHVGKSPKESYPGLTVSHDGDAIVVRIPVRFHRRNGRQMVLTHGGSNGQAAPERETNGSLVSALAKAYRWQEQLEWGEYASLEDLAAANGVDRTYVGRILRLTSLAPEIVERILDGDEPEGVSLRRLQKDLPLAWSDQM